MISLSPKLVWARDMLKDLFQFPTCGIPSEADLALSLLAFLSTDEKFLIQADVSVKQTSYILFHLVVSFLGR